MAKDVIKSVETLISDTKFNIDFFSKQEMTSEEFNMIYNRTIGMVVPQRTGNTIFDYNAN